MPKRAPERVFQPVLNSVFARSHKDKDGESFDMRIMREVCCLYEIVKARVEKNSRDWGGEVYSIKKNEGAKQTESAKREAWLDMENESAFESEEGAKCKNVRMMEIKTEKEEKEIYCFK